MPQRGLVFTPPVAFDFHQAIAPNPSRYSVMPRPIFLRSLSRLLSIFLAIKRGKLGHLVGGFSFGIEIDEREALSWGSSLLKITWEKKET